MSAIAEKRLGRAAAYGGAQTERTDWRSDPMITGLGTVTVYVLDPDRAKRFYTETLGFEERTDMSLDGFRWLTVGPKGQPDFEILLAVPAQPMFSAADAEVVRGLVVKGALGGGVLDTDDCRRTYAELKAKGVTFLQEPAERPYGVEAILRDDSGNWFSLTEERPFDPTVGPAHA